MKDNICVGQPNTLSNYNGIVKSLKPEDELFFNSVLVRFNTEHLSNDALPKWRLFVNGILFLVNEIKILCHSETHTTLDEHSQLLKHHIKILNANFIEFEVKENGLKIAKIIGHN